MELEEKPKLFSIVFYPFLFVASLWVVYVIEWQMGANFSHYGIKPRDLSGLLGIFTGPFIHGDIYHLINNSIPLFVIGVGISYFYKEVALKVLIWTFLMTGLWVWSAARPSYHIGASGVLYGLASFVFFSGIIRKYTKLLALSMLVVFLYGGMVWGIFPIKSGISWESHMLGAIAGLLVAINYRKEGPSRKKFDWELEDDEDEDEEEDEDETPDGEDKGTQITYTYRPANGKPTSH